MNTSNTFFNTFENTTRKECEYLCNNISECRGYAGDDLNQICGLSYSSQNGNLENCTACTNLVKQCPVGKKLEIKVLRQGVVALRHDHVDTTRHGRSFHNR